MASSSEPVNDLVGICRVILEELKRSNERNEVNQRIILEQRELLKSMKWELNLARRIQENLRVTLTAPVLDQMQAFLAERQLGMMETLQHIKEHKSSLSRYGDGELRLMHRLDFNLAFQKNSRSLQASLKSVLQDQYSQRDNMLVGLPHGYRDVFWGGVYGDVWRQTLPALEPISQFANSHVTRPIFFQTYKRDAVNAWSEIWEGLRATVITGKGSRFNLVPDLFDSALSIDFLHTEAKDAFEHLDSIADEAKNYAADIYLISLGPAGTVLANTLANENLWALDIGHLSKSYAYEFDGALFPEHT